MANLPEIAKRDKAAAVYCMTEGCLAGDTCVGCPQLCEQERCWERAHSEDFFRALVELIEEETS